MKLSILCGLLFYMLPSFSLAQETEIKQVIATFFEGFHQRDTLKIQSVCNEKLQIQSVITSTKGATLLSESINDFYRDIADMSSETLFEEQLLGYEISVYGAMALVRTPYKFYFNEKVSHTGVNVFTLYYDGTFWKILNIINTREIYKL